jgi:hypothetical protein
LVKILNQNGIDCKNYLDLNPVEFQRLEYHQRTLQEEQARELQLYNTATSSATQTTASVLAQPTKPPRIADEGPYSSRPTFPCIENNLPQPSPLPPPFIEYYQPHQFPQLRPCIENNLLLDKRIGLLE